MTLLVILLIIWAGLLGAAIIFTVDSIMEKEYRAPRVGMTAVVLLLIMGCLITFSPSLRIPIAVFYLVLISVGIVFVIPGKSNAHSLNGAMGYGVEEIKRFDERDIVFARNFCLPPDSDVYRRYYKMHPQKEGPDADRRKKGGPVGNKRGIIDNCHPPTVAMANAIESFSSILRDSPASASRVSGPNSDSEEKASKDAIDMDPSEATVIVKGFAKYLGSDLVGVCRSNPKWSYSHRGMVFKDRWDGWGEEIPDPLPYTVVIATQMGLENVGAAPHTPVSVESEFNYALGACITIPLAQWFVEMGYQAKAQFAGTYDANMVPLAIDAGLGELGRFGYLITDEFGPRVRLFAVTTDMPLVTDEPVDLGAEEFCLKCLKCAETCPSRSIPDGDRTVVNGIHRWKLDEDSCFEYWAKVGTGCSICMGICPFSRPNRSFHRIVRWMLKRSPLARNIFPYLDNTIYGRKWHPRKVSAWVGYPGNK